MVGIYIVLAAGRGIDAGPPLAMREVDGETLLSHHVHAAQLARLAGPLCVTGPDADVVEGEHVGFPVKFIRNDVPDSPMILSVRLALASAPRENAAYIFPVDVMPPRIDTFDLLAEAIETVPGGMVCVRPIMRGEPGYPVVLLPDGVEEVLGDSRLEGLGDWVETATRQGRVLEVEVDDYNVISNLHRSDPSRGGASR